MNVSNDFVSYGNQQTSLAADAHFLFVCMGNLHQYYVPPAKDQRHLNEMFISYLIRVLTICIHENQSDVYYCSTIL